jgi:hypothetical protein
MTGDAYKLIVDQNKSLAQQTVGCGKISFFPFRRILYKRWMGMCFHVLMTLQAYTWAKDNFFAMMFDFLVCI